MSIDWYQQLLQLPGAEPLAGRLGLPHPPRLRRFRPGADLLTGPALVAAGPGGRLAEQAHEALSGAGVEVVSDAGEDGVRYGAIVFDASGLGDVESLESLRAAVGPPFRRLAPSGRLLVLGTPPGEAGDPTRAAVQRGLEGFVRSAGKEARAGATANLVYVGEGAEAALASALSFFCSGRSAYVSGQAVSLSPVGAQPRPEGDRPLEGRVAVVTGAARGLGAATAEVLARDGAHVVLLDVPGQGEQLVTAANRLGGTAVQLDITAADAPGRLASLLLERHGGLDILVHNAGITRDKSLANMDPDRWSAVLQVNLGAQLRINAELLARDAVRPDSRVICLSSTSGIAGNRGQTNYATSKAGIIGMVEAWAPVFAERQATINAVAPGFMETEMTAAMPVAARELGRRVNSMSQGGQPVDVGETVAWLAQPGTGVNGQTVRVCGQSILGA
ncbi:MAG TPA: 3-oxoacyl-ACP reductase [Acidimicrobiales bacterium]|jgi:3-oxoacyl-[acyl-carrier protein] reductase|nr:3-oxoacyl-ACP reductase [Acidimicrobiales bacterium]